jgi:hypothetical protein
LVGSRAVTSEPDSPRRFGWFRANPALCDFYARQIG